VVRKESKINDVNIAVKVKVSSLVHLPYERNCLVVFDAPRFSKIPVGTSTIFENADFTDGF